MSDPAAITQRIARLQAAMRTEGIDCLLCLKPENSFYLSGFNPIIYSHPVVAILPQSGPPTLLVHALRDDHARASSFVRDIRLFGAWSTKETMGPDWLAALAAILAERGVGTGTIGLELDSLPVARFRAFERTLPGARFADASALIEHARMIKDAGEIANARIAARIADAGMDAALAAIGSGGSERDVSLAAMAAMDNAWSKDHPEIEVCDFGSLEGGVHSGLACWCLTGERVAINADNPTSRRPARGEIAVIFIWSVCNGVHAENERSVAIGALPPERRAAYEAVLAVREKVETALRPGVRIADLFGTARAEYERLGYGRYLPGRIGHGIGLGAHEHLSLDGRNQTPLQPGMLLTFEPNLRIPEWGGLQHSDTVLITETGFEFLTATRRGYIEVAAG